jgi:DnaK suppressor protein
MKGSETKPATKSTQVVVAPSAASGAAKPTATAKPASRATAGSKTKIAATAKAGSKATGGQPSVKASDPAEEKTAGLADKMKTSVVSKVSEVMTKTTKSNSAVNTEGRVLSEDEIRAMGEKDYMNAEQLAFFKARLQQLEKDLLKNAGETTEHLRETVLVPDPADRATIEEEHALELRTRDRERKLLKKVQQSIASIDAGEYGWCEETGEPIGIPRLIARPTATLSLEAQQRRELKQKLYGD